MISSLRPPARSALLLALSAAAGALLAGCDNPGCIFSPDGCGSNGSGSIGSEPAAVPSNHAWMRTGPPLLTGTHPEGSTVHPDSPLVLVFNESMASANLSGAFQLAQSGGFGQVLPIAQVAVVGDGRMLVLFPPVALSLGASYTLRYTDTAVVTDLQGSPVAVPEDREILSFQVAGSASIPPKVLVTWPPDGATNQSPFGEFVAVFDRRVNSSSVDTDSFDIAVGGSPPPFDPLPQALLTFSGGVPLTDSRVWRWRSVDGEGEAVDLGRDATVTVTLSDTGDAITLADGSSLGKQVIDYETASFSPPVAAEVVSLPFDGIGIAHLTGGNAKVGELEIALSVDDGQASDVIGVFVVGRAKNVSPPENAVLYREFELGDVPYDPNTHVATLRESEVDLASKTSPLATRFADGPIWLAFQRKRGSATTPVRVLDSDPDESGVQTPTQDTQAPTLTGWGLSGADKQSFRADLRNFALVGRASEPLESVEVVTSLGDNGVLPPVAASNASNVFVAQPFTQAVFLDALDPGAGNNPLAFSAVLYDRALNASSTLGGTFTQLGAVGTGGALGATVTVQVFDARTLGSIAGANVFTHEDFVLTVDPLDSDVTDANGLATLDAGAVGDTLLSVDAPGYDLVTVHAVATDRVSIGLTKTGLALGTVDGLLFSTDAGVGDFERVFADTRKLAADEPLEDVQICSLDVAEQRFECSFGPYDAFPNRIGAVSIGVLDLPLVAAAFAPASFLRGFAIEVPVKHVASNGSQDVEIEIERLLDDPTTPLEDEPVDGPQTVLDASAITGLDVGDLAGEPAVYLESPIPGLARNGVVGFGAAFDLTGGLWDLRSAFPGIADPDDTTYPGDQKGELVLDGTIDPDPMLHCELRDVYGARVGRRPRRSAIGGTTSAPSAPQLLVPVPGTGSTGGEGFDVEFENSLPDALGVPGLYRVTLVDGVGRAWRIYAADPSDAAATVRVHAPDLPASGGVGLADGTIYATLEAFAWSGFAWDAFFWTDVEREHDHFAASAPATFAKP